MSAQRSVYSAYHIGFVLGPCLNATGRLDTADRALCLFRTTEEAEAAVIAGELKALNDNRKDMTLQGTQAAMEMIEARGLEKDKVLGHRHWHVNMYYFFKILFRQSTMFIQVDAKRFHIRFRHGDACRHTRQKQ